jgi:hypothetical protein
MEEFVKAKQLFNEKVLQKKEDFKTAEEYLSVYFTSKYGVKSLAISGSLAFIRSL